MTVPCKVLWVVYMTPESSFGTSRLAYKFITASIPLDKPSSHSCYGVIILKLFWRSIVASQHGSPGTSTDYATFSSCLFLPHTSFLWKFCICIGEYALLLVMLLPLSMAHVLATTNQTPTAYQVGIPICLLPEHRILHKANLGLRKKSNLLYLSIFCGR